MVSSAAVYLDVRDIDAALDKQRNMLDRQLNQEASDKLDAGGRSPSASNA